jgi:hypothetical protein
MTKPLSPAAQVVLNALLEAKFGKGAVELGFPVMSVILGRELAAALRVAAEQCHCQEIREADYTTRRWVCVDELLAIAAELEGGND